MTVPTQGFSLLRLPYLAIEEVIGVMDPFEIIAFSMASSKCKSLTKACSNLSKKYHLFLFIGEDPSFCMTADDIEFEYRMTSDAAQDGVRKIDEDDKEVEVVSSFFEYAKEVLNLKINEILYTIDDFPGENQNITDWLKGLTPSYYSVEIDGEEIPHEKVQYLLDNLSIQEELILDVETFSNLPLKIQNGPRRLKFSSAEWFKLEHLLSLDAPFRTIGNGILSHKDLNLFLRKWMLAECHNNLCQLEVDIPDRRTFFRIFHELVLEQPDRNLPKRQFVDIAYVEGVTIKNKSGILANLQALGMDDYFVFRMSIVEKDG